MLDRPRMVAATEPSYKIRSATVNRACCAKGPVLSFPSPRSERLSRLIEASLAAATRVKLPLVLLSFSLTYFLAAKLGIATRLPPDGIVTLWPANAITLAFLLHVKREWWPLFFFATVATEIIADVPTYPLWAATGYGIVNFAEAAIAAVLLTRLLNAKRLIAGVREFIVYVLAGPVLASGTAALFGAAIYKIGNPTIDYFHYWKVFWFGDALGLLVLGTILLGWRGPPNSGVRQSYSAIEASALALALLGTAVWLFFTGVEAPSLYLLFPFLIWAALRFGSRGAFAATLATVVIAITATTQGIGPFSSLSTIENVTSLQGLIAAVALSTFALGFSTEELEGINTRLDQIVAERTSELRQSLERNEILLKELHHRIKNNLQVVSSILSLHQKSAIDPVMREKLSSVQGQIGSIATAYDILQQQQQLQRGEAVDFSEVLKALCNNIAKAGGGRVSIRTEVSGEAVVSADIAVALSLALNEVITNAIKHIPASPTVTVSCQGIGDRVSVRITDNGPGLPPNFDLARAKGFGMRMIRGLVAQIHGDVQFSSGDSGTVVEISAPLLRHS